ncbi:hypothetical protein SFC43_01760 [Bacteroides sp. CR5/BHMF/2]|nr:hypothetical protein [Bacteroides sp. CR5/BHMF/2]
MGADFMRADEEDTFPIKVYETIKSSNKTKCLIDISELRIGNLVKIKTSNDAAYYPIYAIDGMGLKVILGGVRQCEGWKDISLLKPIRITETLLGKLDFNSLLKEMMLTNKYGDQKKDLKFGNTLKVLAVT